MRGTRPTGGQLIVCDETAETARLARCAAKVGKDDAVALCSGGFALAYVVGDLDNGAAMIDRALLLNPNLAAAWTYGGWVWIWRGEPEVALNHFERAMRLSPLDPTRLARKPGRRPLISFAGHYDEASSWAERSLREQPGHTPPLRVLAASSALAGRLEDAHAAIARLRQLEPAFRISDLRDRGTPLRRPQDLATLADGLRRGRTARVTSAPLE